jgi:hypothetical protein
MAKASTTGAAPKSRNDTLDLPDWLLLLDKGDLTEFLVKLRHVFRQVYIVTLVAMLLLVPLSIWLNGTEARWLNVVPIFVMAAFTVYHALDPYKFLAWFGYGAVSYGGLPNTRIMEILKLNFPDFEIQKFIAAGGQGVKLGWDLFSVVWLFWFMWFMVLATIPAEAGPTYMLLAVLLAWGAISIKWAVGAKWYRRICITITTAFTVLFVWQAFIAKTDVWRVATAGPIVVQQVVVDTAPQPLAHFVDRAYQGSIQGGERQVVNVPDGCYSFSAVGPDVLFDNHPEFAMALADIIRLNGHDAGWVFPIEGNQVTVSIDSSFGTGTLVGSGYEVVDITLTPKTCPE